MNRPGCFEDCARCGAECKTETETREYVKKEIIRIRTRNDKIVRRGAEVVEKIDSDGQRYGVAWIGAVPYYVEDRDASGPIWATGLNIQLRKDAAKRAADVAAHGWTPENSID